MNEHAFHGTSGRVARGIRDLKRAVVVAAVATVFSGPVWSGELDKAAESMQAGALVEARLQIDEALAKTPLDPSAQFLKGLILTKQGLTQQAIGLFTSLTEDYPGLPEPYNNLAVLLAEAGYLEDARVALQSAIALKPDYGVAYANLAGVHVELARAAHQHARRSGYAPADSSFAQPFQRAAAEQSAASSRQIMSELPSQQLPAAHK